MIKVPKAGCGGFMLDSSYKGIRLSVRAENPIPEEIDNREIAVRMTVMGEVKFLHSSEPYISSKP